MKNIFKKMNEMMNEKKMGKMKMKMSEKMNKGIENLKNLKNLMQIFCNFVNLVKLVMQIFHKFATFAMSIFKRSSVATLRTVPVKSTVKVALKSRISPFLPLLATDSILSRFCLVSLIWLVVGGFTTSAWGANVAETTATLVGKNQNVTSNGVTFSISGDVSRGNLFVSYYFQESGKEATLSWSGVPANYTINVSQISFKARAYNKGGSGQYKTSKCSTYYTFMDNNQSSWIENPPVTLNSSTYFGLGNDGTITLKAISKQLNYDDIVFTYTIGNNYSIVFNANGGSGSMSDLSMAYYIAKNLTANAFTRSYSITYDENGGDVVDDDEVEYTFAGWATSEDGNVVYSNGQSVQNLTTTVNGVENLYAKWNSASVTLPTPTKDGYQFEGWYVGSIAPANKIETATYTPSSDVTLVANWVGKYDLDIRGVSTTINNDAWNLTDAFNFVRADKEHMTVNIGNEDVIGYDMASNTITAKAIGSSTISFTQNNTSATVNEGTSSVWTIKVDSVANTLAVSGTEFTQYVDDEIIGVRSGQNSNGTISTTSSNSNLAHYDIVNNKIVIPNTDELSSPLGNVTITITQAATAKYKFKKHTITLTVNKKTPSFSGSAYNDLKVDDVQTADYSYSNVSAAKPTASSDDDFYYTIDDISYTNLSKNKKYNSLDSLVRFNPDNKQITALNAGTAKITFHQRETRIYNAGSQSFNVAVAKHTNTIYVNGNAEYSSTMYMDRDHDAIVLTATNTDYTNYPVTISQTAAEGEVSYDYNTSTRTVSVSSHQYLSTATWRMQQEENYKYQEGDNTFSVEVVRAPEATDCYVAYQPWTKKGDYEGHVYYDGTEDPIALSGPGDLLYFDGATDGACVSPGFTIQFSTNGRDYTEETSMSLTNSTTYRSYGPYKLPDGTTHIRFNGDGTEDKYHRNLRVTRKTYLNADAITINRTSTDNPVYPSEGTGVGSLTVNYSIANGGDLKISNDNPKFTLSQNTISGVDCTTGTADINIQYNSAVAGEDVAQLVIYNDVYRREVTVTGVCVKHDQSGAWKENIGKLQLGTKVGKPFRSTMSGSYGVVYTSSDATKVAISASGDTLIANAVGTARIYAEVRGDENYYAIRDSIDITVTTDYVQYIVWNQDSELRRLKLGDANFVMNAYATSDLDECSTNGPDAESPRTVTYTSNRPTVVEVVNGNELRIVGVGTAIVLASVEEGEDADGHSYIEAELAKEVVVRDPNAPCGADEIYSRPDETRLDHQSGDRYSSEFSFGGKEPGLYSVVYKGEKGNNKEPEGTVYVEQYIGDSWRVAGSGTIEVKSRYDTIRGTLERTATKIRIRTNGKGHHYFKEISVLRAKYIEVVESAIVKDTLAFSSYIGTPQAKDVEVRWSDSRNDILLNLPEGAPFTLSSEDIAADCNGIDTVDLRITFNTMVSQTDSCYNLVLTDGVTTKTIVLKATATADEVTFGSDGDWTENDENWSRVPNENTIATIASNVNVTISTEVEVYSLIVEEAATVTVTPTGGLTIGAGGIIGAAKDNIKIQVSTAGATKGESGYVRISPEYKGEMPEVTIETYTKGYLNSSTGVVTWQYMGSPISGDTAASKVFGAKTFIYTWDESQGKWVNKKSKMKLEPFKGYAVSQSIEAGGKKITYDGQLVDVRDSVVIPLQYTESSKAAGCNVIANSFAAPIDISRLTPADFSDGVEATVNLFNTGSQSDIENCVRAGSVNVAAAGQYLSIPVSSAKRMYSLESYPIVIPPMQGFYVNTNKAGSLTLNYERLVWNADYEKYGNQPLRSPKRAAQAEDEEEDELSGTLKVTLLTESGLDHMYLLESPTNMPEYENGYDAKKIMSGDLNVFAVEEEDQLAVDATNSIAGTKIGVRTGDETEYKMTFSKLNSEVGLSLRDKELGLEIAIYEGTEYIFYAEPNEVISERFEIVERFGAPNVTTGNDGVGAEVNAQKFIKDNSLYIYKDGVLFNALGERVR